MDDGGNEVEGTSRKVTTRAAEQSHDRRAARDSVEAPDIENFAYAWSESLGIARSFYRDRP